MSRGLAILHEDDALLVIAKPAGLLTVATAGERARTAYWMLTDHVRRGAPRSRHRVFIVHRLDRETSGLLVFAKSEPVKRALQDGWEAVEKHYLAVVHGRVGPEADTITSYLAENQAHGVYATGDRIRGKLARTAYRVLRRTAKFTLLELDLLTGRKHQIRVHLADLGHPVVGDRRYGPPDKARREMALHAFRLAFTHPLTGERLRFETPPPPCFARLIGGRADATAAPRKPGRNEKRS